MLEVMGESYERGRVGVNKTGGLEQGARDLHFVASVK